MAGVKESKELLAFVVEFGNACGKSFEDGKFSLFEMSNFIGAMMKAPTALEGITALPAELSDLDEAEKAELMAMVSGLKLPMEKLELAAQLVLKTAVQLAEFVKLWKTA